MRRGLLSLAAVYLCLLLAFCCGMGELLLVEKEERPSSGENRMLRGFPELTAESLLSGEYMDGFEGFLSDGFFFRGEASAFSDATKGLFSLYRPEDAARNPTEEQLLAPVGNEPEETAAAAVDTETAPGAMTGPRSVAAMLPTPTVTRDASVWVRMRDGRQVDLFTYRAEDLAVAARVFNEYRAALPADGSLRYVCPMVSRISDMLLYDGQADDWGSEVDDVLAPVVDEGVFLYDSAEILSPHIGRERLYLYPTVDHHWHPISACFNVQAMVADQGLPTMDYFEFRYYPLHFGQGQPAEREELENMTLSRETVLIMEPRSPVEAYLLRDVTEQTPSTFISGNKDGYIQYLGVLQEQWRVFRGGFHTGRSALVIGDSFTHVAIPYLLPYYDQVLSVDFRSQYNELLAGGSVQDFLAAYEIDDIYIISSTYTPISGPVFQTAMERYFFA